jgi:polysaccharide biosynthesis/export protein
MKNYQKILLIIFISAVSFSSCRNVKDLTLIKDVENGGIIKTIPKANLDHQLKIGDILYISIKSTNPEVNMLFNPESNMEANSYGSYQKWDSPSGAYLYGNEIDNEGNVSLPMLGKIYLLGIPVSQVEDVIQKKVDEYLKDGIVKVKLLNFKVTVVGEVSRPGVYYNYNNSITVVQALAMASGGTDYSSIKSVVVVRALPEGNKSFVLDMRSKDIYLSEAFYLQPNDYVVVQPDKNKNIQLNAALYSMVISSLSLMLLTYSAFFK